MDSHNECSLSNEVATQACDQCYRCKLRCSRTQPACHRCQGIGSACTWSMGKWLGKPKSTKRKVDDGKEQAELTRGQQECPSPGKKTAASRYRSQSGDEAYIPEEGNTPFLWILVHCSDIRRVVWSNSKSAEGAPPVTEKRTDIYGQYRKEKTGYSESNSSLSYYRRLAFGLFANSWGSSLKRGR